MDLFACNMTNIYKDNIPSYLKACSIRAFFRGTFMNEHNFKSFFITTIILLFNKMLLQNCTY